MVGVFLETGVHFHLTRIHLLNVRWYAVPSGECRIARSEFGVGRNHSELLLSCKRLLAQFVPALIELAFVFVAPFLRHLVGGMTCTSRKIKKERFVRRLRFLITNPGDRVVDHRIIEIKVFVLRHADDVVVLGKQRIELTVFSSKKSPEVVKPERVRPAIKRTCGPLLRVGCEMPLADRSSVVTIGPKNLRDGRGASRPIRTVAWPTTDQFRDRAKSHRMMVPS